MRILLLTGRCAFVRELSHGNFTNDNYKQLAGAEGGIPIYQAKIMLGFSLIVSFTKCS